MTRAASHASNRRLLLDQKAEAVLYAKLFSDDPKAPLNAQVAVAACGAVAALCEGESNSEVLGQLGTVKRLFALLTHAEVPCVAAAAATLAALLANVWCRVTLGLFSNVFMRLFY